MAYTAIYKAVAKPEPSDELSRNYPVALRIIRTYTCDGGNGVATKPFLNPPYRREFSVLMEEMGIDTSSFSYLYSVDKILFRNAEDAVLVYLRFA